MFLASLAGFHTACAVNTKGQPYKIWKDTITPRATRTGRIEDGKGGTEKAADEKPTGAQIEYQRGVTTPSPSVCVLGRKRIILQIPFEGSRFQNEVRRNRVGANNKLPMGSILKIVHRTVNLLTSPRQLTNKEIP